jgi:hypothetical protein
MVHLEEIEAAHQVGPAPGEGAESGTQIHVLLDAPADRACNLLLYETGPLAREQTRGMLSLVLSCRQRRQ